MQKKRAPSLFVFLSLATVFALLTGSQWLWQYSKFTHVHGLFYYISPEHGGLIITTICILEFVVAIVVILKNGDTL